jgi:hypothetical protein
MTASPVKDDTGGTVTEDFAIAPKHKLGIVLRAEFPPIALENTKAPFQSGNDVDENLSLAH